MKRVPWLALPFAIGAVLVSAGCAQPPKVGIGDPAVFTALHWRAAQESLHADSGKHASAIDDMNRYFRTPADDYSTTKLRMDVMLDSTQRRQSIAQAVASSLALNLAFAASQSTPAPSSAAACTNTGTSGSGSKGASATSEGKSATTEGESTQPAKATPSVVDAIKALAEQLAKQSDETTAADSPFDMIDRAFDFYYAYLLKQLRLYGIDSRVLPQEQV